ncbi:hypothetical protein ACCS64_37800, partial [Rhizobium ruizarguesonis]
FSSANREGLRASTTRPGMLPIAKHMAESWNGGILPEAANVYAPVYVRIPTEYGMVTITAVKYGRNS